MHRLSGLRALRERASMTQGELAKRSGLGRATIAALEVDRGRRAQPSTARKIADALGIGVEELHRAIGRAAEAPGPSRAVPLTAIYERGEEGWWVARCPEIPGAISQGRTLDEAREMLRDATLLLMGTRRDVELERVEGQPDVIRESLELWDEPTKGEEQA